MSYTRVNWEDSPSTKTPINATNLNTMDKGILDNYTYIYHATRRTRRNITSDLSNLATATSEQDLAKYGYALGDYFTGASGYTYILADMNPYYGGYNNNAVVSTKHIGILVNTHANHAYHSSGNPSSYYESDLYTYMTGDVLTNIKSDFTKLFGSSDSHLLSHNMLNNAIGAWRDPTWYSTRIENLTEVQIYGSRVFGADGYQTGTGNKKLEVFSKFRYNELFGNMLFWLRSLVAASNACLAGDGGYANGGAVSGSLGVVGLILFH
jgi:hypothetical protein